MYLTQRLHGRGHPKVAVLDRYYSTVTYSPLCATQRLHGRGHPKVAAALGSLATLAEQQLDYDKSILLHEQSLEIKRRCLGPEHQTVSTTLVNIARVRDSLVPP